MESEPNKTIKEHLRCQFSHDEKMELSEELANNLTKKRRVEGRQRSTNAEYKKELKSLDERIEELSDWVSSGYELREVDCSVYFHEPKQGQKTVIRDDTGEVVNVCLMTADDMQMALDLEQPVAGEDEDDDPDDEETAEEEAHVIVEEGAEEDED